MTTSRKTYQNDGTSLKLNWMHLDRQQISCCDRIAGKNFSLSGVVFRWCADNANPIYVEKSQNPAIWQYFSSHAGLDADAKSSTSDQAMSILTKYCRI
ncbi:hypothetical protein H6F67_12060 [Microcoleus sp. FACHB-1515]|uniref:hypothetical protein n=1 Tax=Cyanophyceae TaxID=3028117 RepID=UPI001687D77C|nr:hypothetical protein [Microcoleus sp. FACHB-1515]MBD2090589.1 hypothetical protein [Microcoleus sp. FACHB-1515]